LPGISLKVEETPLIPDVRRHGHDLSIPLAHQLGVDHGLADPDIREEPTVAVTGLDIQLEAHVAAGDETVVHFPRFATAGLLPARRMMDLRRVDSDVADLLDAVVQPHVNGVAVDHLDDQPLDRTGAGRPDVRGKSKNKEEEPDEA
jgi:hypothetical protein